MIRPVLGFIPVLALIACSPKSEAPPPTEAETSASSSASISASKAADVAAGYVGRWTGPEATSLEIVARQHDYEVTVSGTQTPGVFTGTVNGDALQIERNGEVQLIRHTTGARTGVKFLADKNDCVSVGQGEGYCRD
ncbi:hypothetical protein [Asticcacaulis sp. AND118]|uniref:hypothetical protein n=1 Tax=Asticcacaulis sp. AND118 TaxID=2840468 RepID=UPI001CFFD1A0|nr:hypothetical protein [Asticcacaulis sp. AND118]UDF05189.1 hypothetical protein LH365_17520 [Asticcacaulis sp. AND118]